MILIKLEIIDEYWYSWGLGVGSWELGVDEEETPEGVSLSVGY